MVEIKDLCRYELTEFETEELKVFVRNRNKQYLEFLKSLVGEVFSTDVTSIKLLRNPHKPNIVINDSLTLSCYIKNYQWVLLDDFCGGDKVHICSISSKVFYEDIRRQLNKVKLQRVYRLKDECDDYLKNVINNEAMYDNDNPRLFFVIGRAESFQRELTRHNYNFEIINDLDFELYADKGEFKSQILK